VGGALGAVGHHVQLLVVMVVNRPDNVCAITPHHQWVGLIVLATETNSRVVAAVQLVLVRRVCTSRWCLRGVNEAS